MKTGKTHTEGDYIQEPGEIIHFAEGNDNTNLEKQSPGMVRFNTDKKLLEVMTRRGWQKLLTQDQISDEPGKKLVDGIAESLQTAKRMGMVSIYCQGSQVSNHIIDYTARPGNNNWPSWMSEVLPPAQSNTTFAKKLINEGTDVYLFKEIAANGQGTKDLRLYVNVHEYLGISEGDKYKWSYSAVPGISGYGFPSMYNGHVLADINTYPAWDPPSPDASPDNDTSVNYGRFLVKIQFKYGKGGSSNSSNYNANFNILFNAKKFKGFS
ncbi:hypothetical protein CMK18_21130 [Candidatus Poribacteria bacterium]|nr:hypothetical protein [Candidatus Poribacteria bacterium]